MHRKVFYTALLAFLTVSLSAQEKINWLTIEEAVALNQEEPRKFLIDVYTDWCGWCKRMDANTFSDASIASYINKNFHPVKLNGEHKEDIMLGEQTYAFVESGRRGYNELAAVLLDGRMGYPSIVYLNEKLERLTVSPGFKSVNDLKVEINFIAEEAYLDMDFESYRQQFNSDSTSLSLQ